MPDTPASDATIPPGYTTVAALAKIYHRSPQSIRTRLEADHVHSRRYQLPAADRRSRRGRTVVVYLEPAAHFSLRREDLRSRCSAPGYIGLLARAFHLTRGEVKSILARAGVAGEQRICTCCGKPTWFYPDRPAAHRALREHMRGYHTTTHPTTTP